MSQTSKSGKTAGDQASKLPSAGGGAGPLTPPDGAPPTRSRPRIASLLSRYLPVISLIAGVVIWETVSRLGTSIVFVPFGDIAAAGLKMIENGSLIKDLAASGISFFAGYASAVAIGVFVGVALGLSNILRRSFEPWLYAFYSIPIVAIAPIFIIAFGIGDLGHIVVVFTLTVFAIVVNTMAGIGTAEAQYIDVARAYNGNRLDVVRYVLLPSALPFILTGMRLGVTRALIGVVVAELFGARAGIGYMILQAQQRFATADMYVGVLILAAAGILSTSLLGWVERRLATWRPDHQF